MTVARTDPADDEAEHYVVTIRPMASPAELIRMWASLPEDPTRPGPAG